MTNPNAIKTDDSEPYLEVLCGQWIMQNGVVQGDPVEKEIKRRLAQDLDRVKAGNWEELFRDRATGAFWELDYPQSQMHGGGPLRLRRVRADYALRKYGLE